MTACGALFQFSSCLIRCGSASTTFCLHANAALYDSAWRGEVFRRANARQP